ncbi:MAG: xanthine dehydrogenase family protein molybdopterin-binding subunit [Rhodospirillaceae bacterium]|nr:MAG: xanthine dehydrogenase family protein molybdopterin-binding subunit [Rhodospirillaceae bacterium]
MAVAFHGAFKGRKEDQRLLTGQGQFTADWNLPGQLHAVFLRSDRAHAEIIRLDVAAAQAMPGVVAVLTGADMRAANLSAPPCFIPFPGRDGKKMIMPPKDVLAVDRVRCVGQPVAMVVAESEHAAHDALEQISVDYRDLPAVIDVMEAIKAGAPQLYPEVPNNIAFDWEFGDQAATDKIFADAPHVVDVTVNNTRVIVNPMEPNACIAHWDAQGDAQGNKSAGRLEFYRPGQGTNFTRTFTMGYFGPPAEKYRFVSKDVGGSFGARAGANPEYIALMVGARQIGRPIKWVSTRSETILSDYVGRSVMTGGQLAFDNDGRFLAVRYSWHSNVGCYPSDLGAAGALGNLRSGAIGPYRIPAVYGRVAVCLTNTGLLGAYRGAGRPEIAMNLEQLVDAAAMKLGLDRFEIRKRNLIARDQYPYTTPQGTQYDCGDHAALVAIAEEKADWKGFEARRKDAAARGRVRGIGCSSYLESAGTMFPQKEQTQIRFTDDGKVEIYTIAGPSGQGLETTFALVVSRVLGIPYDDITVKNSDPDGPRLTGMGTGGSRSALVYGGALTYGAREVIAKGHTLAADALEAAAQDIEFLEGTFRVKGTDLKIKLTDLAVKHKGALDTIGEVQSEVTFPGGAHVAEVELDPETGTIDVLSYLAVDDCGNVIDHTMVEGQIMGGIVQGVGQVMGEVAHYDQDGQLLTGSFMDYFMPRADLLTRIEIIDYPVPTPTNVLGAKGVGETGCTGGLTTTYSAVMDALRQVGVTQMDMPFTPGRVWEAIQEAKQG